MNNKIKSCLFILTVCTLFGFYYIAIIHSFGARTYNVGEYDAYNMKLKFHRGLSIDEPKLIINSGSNSNFGFNSRLFENEINRPVVNLANHAANRLDYIYYGVKRIAKKGDVVLLPLEPIYYNASSNFRDYHIKTYLRSERDYFESLSLWKKMHFISNIPLNLYLKNRSKQISNKLDVDSLTRDPAPYFSFSFSLEICTNV